jgi:hypothetical protein
MANGTDVSVPWAHRILLVGAILLSSACGGDDVDNGGVIVTSQDPNALLAAGEVAEAISVWKGLYAADPSSTDNAVGAAYGALLEGRLSDADSILASVEPTAGADLGGIRVRRALIALEMGDNAKVLEYGKSSGTAEGQVLAAEAALCDSDWDSAKLLFSPIRTAPAPVGTTATVYFDRLEQTEPVWGSLAEAEACWAMGQRSWAVESIKDVFDALPASWENLAEEAVVWASRALREGQLDVAKALVKKSDGLPAYQKWRGDATTAHILCAEGKARACVQKLQALDSSAPPMGLSHARAMGAMLLGAEHSKQAMVLLGEDQTVAAAHAALSIGDSAEALRHAPPSIFKKLLKD